MWRGGLLHLGRLPHLPGVPHLHVNRPLELDRTATKQNINSDINTYISTWTGFLYNNYVISLKIQNF